jgi:lipopolysaccharide export system permease protein
MKTLHGYLVREILATLVMTVAVFTFVLLLGNVLKEILAMLVNRQTTFAMAAQAVGLLIPFVMVFALPMGMLTAALLFFGRFSADQELTAVRASGVSLVALITPIFLLSVALSGACALINLEVAPQCRVAYKKLLAAGISRLGVFIPEKTYIKDFPGLIVYADKVRGTNLTDIRIYKFAGQDIDYIRASSGTLETDPAAAGVLHLHLFDAWRVGMLNGESAPVVYAEESLRSITNKLVAPSEEKVKLTDMTFFQLWDELQDVEKRLGTSPAIRGLPTPQLRARMLELVREQRSDLTLPLKVQIHRQISFSFACIGFTLVGIPLGIRAHRRETTFGIAMALLLVLLYYSFFILGQSLETRPGWFPCMILWVPNFLFQAVGAVLLWRANRGV